MTHATRRGFLGLASAGAASLLPAGPGRAAEATASAVDDACILTPQSEEGPYYLDPKLVRADITEGRPGVPLSLQLRVIEAGSCTPIAGARVDIWHCDAHGLYSAFRDQGDGHNIDQTGKTFLRGTQLADPGGWAAFSTIYPGWYAGRATHVHFKVFLDEHTALTGQTFFPEALNEFIYNNVPDYTGRPKQRLVINANDRVATQADPDHRAYCAVKEERDRYVALLTLAVDRNARPSADIMPSGPPTRAPWIKDRLAALVPGLRRSPF
ncbi:MULTISPECIES: intradiol ring-cleavage dioxygenase [unclassified Bradyrhizobium]|uniref:intradiol ring-cleavage dioxygenase n=1 Tax=unclassified Bradyrhizobium TaxID=2631580 RepID=UPI002915DBA5|nr:MULTISPECIES: intradiol ring-cleavage dioxygenase [unclassified Bradyrhizobium]